MELTRREFLVTGLALLAGAMVEPFTLVWRQPVIRHWRAHLAERYAGRLRRIHSRRAHLQAPWAG